MCSYCDSKLCDDLVTRASIAVDDLRKIFHRYEISIIFLDRFIGRNRCTTGSRKIHDPTNPSRILSYGRPSCYIYKAARLIRLLPDIWYDLPCRIYEAEQEYNWHFILFTVYVHYSVATKKTVVFYIHRLGSEHHSSAEESSRKVKHRVKLALQRTLQAPAALTALRNSPFPVQLPTVTCAIIFWTETLHKERLNMWAKEDEGTKNLESINTGYLHNIARYVHSYKANIDILQRTLDFVNDEHRWFAKTLGNATSYDLDSCSFQTINDSLASQCFQIRTIFIWADEVVKRTQILIDLVCFVSFSPVRGLPRLTILI